MNIAFHTAVSGMSAYQNQMDVLSNNLANVNTNGYKASRLSFGDLVYTQMDINNQKAELVGHGVRPLQSDLIFAQSGFNMTGFPLDFAINGDGFFAVENSKGEKVYTRNGAFDISLQGNKGFLVTASGEYVLGSTGKRIAIDIKEGTKNFDLSGLADKIGMFTFKNPYGLQPTSGGFIPTDAAGAAAAVKKTANGKDMSCELLQYALETSTVDVAQTMTDVMLTQKAYQFNSKMVQTADEIEEIVNNLRR